MPEVIHLISNRDNSGGSIAAVNLHTELLKQGYNSSILSTDELGGKRSDVGYRRFGGLTGRLQQSFLQLENILAKPGLINPMDSLLAPANLDDFAGILHIHVTHVAQISYQLISRLARNNTVFWTLHDLWPLTGKCIYPTYCHKYLETCQNCPKLAEYPRLKWDTTTNLHHFKKRFITRHKINFISPSKWIEQENFQYISSLGGTIQTVVHGVNRNFFFKGNKKKLRESYRLPVDSEYILFPQGRWDDPKKGISWYKNMVDQLVSQPPIGRNVIFARIEGDEIKFKPLNSSVMELSLPATNNQHVMADYYNLSDVSVSLSETETFGLCVAESLACQTPVIARKANGVNELLGFDGKILVNSPSDLLKIITEQTYRDVHYQPYYENIDDLSIHAKKHIDLYEQKPQSSI
ncbi:glycosyltransferase [Pedobacter sp. AW1-32]|uniref:glycosyltransferase n=1 Tax=Pedobacter sp. AW1-32 TaxID=3383026 RepID=UPI003FEF3E3E